MTEFETALELFLEGRLELAGLQSVLSRSLQANPAGAAQNLSALQEHYKAGRLSGQLYATLAEQISPQPAATPVSTPTDADATSPTGTTDRSQTPAAPSEVPPDDGDKTRLKMPASSESSQGPAAPGPSSDATRITQTGASVSQRSWSPGTTGPTGATGATGSTGSSWGDPAKWAEQPAPSLQTGSLLKNRFILEEEIGKGGMGVVFKARDVRKEEAQDRNPYVAVKILNDEFRRHPESLKALQRESRKAQDLAHPNIVTVFDFDRDGPIVYMTMEYLEGESLDRVIKRPAFRGLPPAEALPLIAGLARALAYAHDKGIVHSDFKPGNVFMTKDGSIKVFDFGIARAAKLPDEQSGEETKFDPGTLGALTPAYASCEMLDGEEPDPRDDIYALACVSYELLTGQHPFSKRPASDARDQGLTPAPVPGLTRRQWRGLQRGLAFRRQDRSPDVNVFLDELRIRKRNKTSIGIGVAAGIAVASFGVFIVPGILQERRIEGMIAEITGADAGSIPEVLRALNGFEADERTSVLADGGVEDRLIEYFVEQIYLARDQLDYPSAEALIERAKSIYDDSNRLSVAAEEVAEEKAQLLAELDDRFKANLEAGSLLPSDGEDITDVLDAYQKIDPQNAALRDPLLPIAYRTAAESQLGEDLDLAKRYLDEGQSRFPDDTALIGIADRIDTLLEVQNREIRIAELQRSLSQALASATTLNDFLQSERDFSLLQTLDPDNRLLAQFSGQVETRVAAQVNAALSENDWPTAQRTVDDHARLMTQEYQVALRASIGEAEKSYMEQVGAVYASLIEAAQSGQLSQAREYFAQLQSDGSDGKVLDDARLTISRAYLGRARDQRAAGEFGGARDTVAEGRQFDSDFAEWQNEIDAIAQAERIQQEGEQVEQRQQRLAKIKQIEDAINARLGLREFDIEAASETLSQIDELGELDPGNVLATGGRNEVAARLANEARAIAVQNDRLAEALELVAQGERLVPGEQVLRDARQDLEAQQQVILASMAQERIENLRAQLDTLVASPTFDGDWESNLRRIIQDLGPVAEQAAYVSAKRREIAGLYTARAETLLAESRFDRADQLLKSSDWFVPDFAAAVAVRDRLTAERNKFEIENRERERAASIDGLKRTFSAQLAAGRFADARSARRDLTRLMPANDPFLRVEAPKAIADAYYQIASRALADKQFDTAADLAREGLKEVADHPELLKLQLEVGTLRLSDNVAKLKSTLQDGEPGDASGARNTLAAVRTAAGGSYTRILADLKKTADERVRSSGSDRDAIIQWVAGIFGDYQPPAVAGPACTLALAGYGRRSQGRCYDYLPDSTTVGPRFVVVPAGGGIGKPFAISRQEISIGDWNAYCRISGNCAERTGANEQLPITNIPVQDAIAYAQWLSASTRHRYRLPKEGEWLLAASAETRGKISPNCLNPQAGLGENLLEVNRGGQNDYGLMNYVGNAQEWVETSPGSYVVRGGAYSDRLGSCNVDLVRPHSGNADSTTGFRLVRELDGGA